MIHEKTSETGIAAHQPDFLSVLLFTRSFAEGLLCLLFHTGSMPGLLSRGLCPCRPEFSRFRQPTYAVGLRQRF